jgi:CheY-like chemotaxis protein
MTRKTVLVAESDEHILNIYKTFLEAGGYTVKTATTKDDLLSMVLKGDFAALITEYTIDNTITLDIFRRLKREYPHIYVMMVTKAAIDLNLYIEVIKSNVDDLFVKPFSVEKMLVHLQKGLNIGEIIYKNKRRMITYPENRFFLRFDEELKRAKRYNRDLSLLFLIPHKEGRKNKHFSKILPMAMKVNIRDTDILTTYNDGYMVILLETPPSASYMIADRLKREIGVYSTFQRDEVLKGLSSGIKIGVSSYPKDSDISEGLIEEVMNRVKTPPPHKMN